MNRFIPYLASATCIIAFVRLGAWQLDRAAYKEGLVTQSARILTDRNPQALAIAADAPKPGSEADAYEWVAGAGHFPAVPAIRLDNQSRNGIAGIRVYRVFQPDGARHALLVEMGWRPLPLRTEFPAEPAPPAITQVRGLMSPPPVAGLHMGKGAIEHQADGPLLAMRIEMDVLSKELHLKNGLAPRVLRLDPGLKIGYKRDLSVLSGTLPPAQHRGYAVQWFGLAAGLLVATIVVARRKPSRGEGEGMA